MASELKRGAIRVLSNYTRLFLFLLLGILFVPIFIHGVGDDAFGLLGLLGSSIGIAEMFQTIVRESMTRELGAAYHSDDPEDFPNTYTAATVICAVLSLAAALAFAILYLLLPYFNISDPLLPAARWLLIAKGTYSVLIVLLGPQYNMYMVTERMVLFNVWIVANRSVDFLAAVTLFVLLGLRDPATGLIAFGFASAGGQVLVLLLAVGLMVAKERRLVPEFSRLRWSEIRKVLSTAGWNGVAVTASNLHIRLDNIIVNLAFGLTLNAAFTLAVRLTSYVRIIAFANTLGLDAVSARVSTTEGHGRLAEIMHHATRVHALVALPAGMVVLPLADPLMHLWVARVTTNPNVVTMAVTISQVLVIGMTARGISDCWTRTLYGAGFIRSYAPLVLAGGILNPIIAIALILLLPRSVSYLGPAIAFAAIFVVFHFGVIPFIAARCLDTSASEIVKPILRPALATLIASPLLFLPRLLSRPDSALLILASLALFGGLMALLAWTYVLTPADRNRLSGAISRRLSWARKPNATPMETTLE